MATVLVAADDDEAAILEPVCPPAGTTRLENGRLDTFLGSQAGHKHVCVARTRWRNHGRVLGIIDAPSGNEDEVFRKLYAVASGRSIKEVFISSHEGATDEETLTRIPGKEVTLDDGSVIHTRGIFRQQNRSLKGVVYQMRQYFPIVGRCIYMVDVRREVDVGAGTYWNVETSRLELKRLPECVAPPAT